MKIAIISPWEVTPTSVGGTERFVIDLAESLNKQGNDVDVYMFDGTPYTLHRVRYLSINLLGTDSVDEYSLRARLGDFSLPETYTNLATLIESLVDLSEYDVIHSNTQLLLRAWPDKKRIFTIHTNPFEFKQAWGDASYQTMVNIAKEEADNIIFTAPSQYYADVFSREIDTDIIYIPHAIDPSRLLSQKDRSELYSYYGLEASKLHILLPSRLEPVQKQPWLLFDALEHLPPSLRNNIEILSSGVDPQYETFKKIYIQQAEKLGAKVYFRRFDYMSDAYAMADIVVLPSRSESFGYAALEALTLGIPTFLNDIPTFHEIAIGNSSAHFFKNSAAHLAEILEQYAARSQNRATPQSEWVDRYSMYKWGKRYEELFV